MKCADCGEPIKESERSSAVACKCGAVMHAECRMSDPGTARDYCEPCFYSPARHALAVKLKPTQKVAKA